MKLFNVTFFTTVIFFLEFHNKVCALTSSSNNYAVRGLDIRIYVALLILLPQLHVSCQAAMPVCRYFGWDVMGGIG
jgi:hypothetical protein